MEIKTVFFLLFILILQSCSTTPKVHHQMQFTSESLGMDRMKLGIDVSSVERFQVAQDLRADPLDKTPRKQDSHSLLFYGSKGVTDSWDLDMTIGPDSPITIGSTIQLFGAPYAGAGASNFSLALRISAGISVTAGEIKASSIQTSSNVQKKREWVMNGYSIYWGLKAGYRFVAPLLSYVVYSRERIGYFIDFMEGVEEESDIDLHHDLLGVGFEYKLGLLGLGLVIAKEEYQIEQDRGQDFDDIYYGLNLSILL